MKNEYAKLLTPVLIGSHVLKNRLVYPNASPHTLQGSETFPAEGFRIYHANLAKNGAAIVTIAEWCNPLQHKGPDSLDFTHMQAFDIKDPSNQNYFSLMAEEIHFFGSKLLICPMVDWPVGYSLYGGPKPGPPAPDGKVEFNKVIPEYMIPDVIENFIKKMELYKNLGYDGMSMRCDMEILPPMGSREGKYSDKSIESRSRFIREVYKKTRERFGKEFILEAEIAWEQPFGYGPNPFGSVNSDDVMEFCKLIDEDVDIFQIRERDGCRSHPTGFNFVQGDHPAVDFAVRMKAEGIKALLEPIGGFQEPDEMDALIGDGKCDLIGMARGFIADSKYGEKLLEGKAEDITPCLKCNKCHGTILDKPDPWLSVCSVNPVHGLAHEIQHLIDPVKKIKKVGVIGGGAAGMRAAIEAATRGHRVTLYEKKEKLGGQLIHGDRFDFKWPIKKYKDWLINQLKKNDIKVILGHAPTSEEVKKEEFDAVLVATGARPKYPANIKGLKDDMGNPLYHVCDDIWNDDVELGNHVIIIGGSETGIETAIYLLRKGHSVTMLTRQSYVGHDCSRLHYITMAFMKEMEDGSYKEAAEWERYEKFSSITNVETVGVKDNTVSYIDKNGEMHSIKGDDVVICGGHEARLTEALSYSDCAGEFYAVGDCIGAGNIQVCTRQAMARASIL